MAHRMDLESPRGSACGMRGLARGGLGPAMEPALDLSAPGAIRGASFIYGYDKPPDVGLDDSGNATFAWRRLDATQSCGPNEGGCWQVQAVRRSASGVMGEVRTLSPPGISAINQQLQVAANGDAVVGWEQGGRVIARSAERRQGSGAAPLHIRPNSSWNRTTRGGSFDMKTNAQGDAEFAWVQNHERA